MKKTNSAILIRTAAAVVLAVLLATTGCVQKELKKDPFFEDWRIRADEARGYSPSRPASLPAKVPASPPLPGSPTAAAAPNVDGVDDEPDDPSKAVTDALEQKPALPTLDISLKVKDVEVATLLRVLARAAGQNILISQNVKGTATVSISEMPWDKVFEGILSTNGLTFAREGDILRIITLKDLQAEIQMMEAQQQKKAKEKEFKLKLNALETEASMAEEPLETFVYHVKYAKRTDLKDNLKQFYLAGFENKSGGGAGKETSGKRKIGDILEDDYSNSLIIHVPKSHMGRLKEALQLLDMPTKQVFIEAYIVQATDSAARQLGVQWGGLYKTTEAGVDHYVTSAATTGDATTAVTPSSGNIVNFPVTGAGFTLGYLGEKLGQHLLSVQLSALETEGKLNILSSPSITTLDNQKAIIESGREIPYQTVDNQNVKIEYKKAVLSLEVTPLCGGREYPDSGNQYE